MEGWTTRWDLPGPVGDSAAELAELLRFAATGEGAPFSGADPLGRLEELLAADEREFVKVWVPGDLLDSERVGLPPPLWERLAGGAGRPEPSGTPLPVGRLEGGEVRGLARGGWEEWWGDAEYPGAVYRGRLWAWGLLRSSGRGAPHPRAIWSAGPAGWSCPPAILALARAHAELGPPLAVGPGPLLRALRATFTRLAEGQGAGRVRPTALAAGWAAWWLPVIGPSRVAARVSGEVAPLAPLARHLSFFALTRRAQAAILGVDQLLGRLDEVGWVEEVVARAGASDAVGLMVDALEGAAGAGGLGSELLRGLAARVAAAPEVAAAAAAWDAGEREDVAEYRVGAVRALACGPGGTQVVVAEDGVRLYAQGEPIRLTGAPGPVEEPQVRLEGGRLVVYGRDPVGQAWRWTAGSPREPRRVASLPPTPEAGAWVEGGVARVDGVAAPLPAGAEVTVVARQGARVAVGTSLGPITVWELADDEPPRLVQELAGHAGPVTALAWVPGRTVRPLWSGGADGAVRGWKLAEREHAALPDGIRRGLRTALASPFGGATLNQWVADMVWTRWVLEDA